MKENQNLDFKQIWKDEYLEYVSGFANSQGGSLLIGVDDKGNVVGVGYTIDIYQKKIDPTRDLITYAAFVSFFPQLLSGPIGRSTDLLPQYARPRTFDYTTAADGLRQFLWGLFKKVVVADGCAQYVDQVWANIQTQTGSTLLLAAVLYSFQIYADFSGYSDMAIGTAKLFGIRLRQNFACPYFSRDIAEFWRRWHISLTSWFRDYIYIPLGGSRCARWKILRNTLIVFLVSGLWHGADWTFVAWGAYHGLLLCLLILLGKSKRFKANTVAHDRLLPSLKAVPDEGDEGKVGFIVPKDC